MQSVVQLNPPGLGPARMCHGMTTRLWPYQCCCKQSNGQQTTSADHSVTVQQAQPKFGKQAKQARHKCVANKRRKLCGRQAKFAWHARHKLLGAEDLGQQHVQQGQQRQVQHDIQESCRQKTTTRVTQDAECTLLLPACYAANKGRRRMRGTLRKRNAVPAHQHRAPDTSNASEAKQTCDVGRSVNNRDTTRERCCPAVCSRACAQARSALHP